MTGLTGKHLNKVWGINAKHALYRADGKFYHNLTLFPGVLFDKQGYIVFNTFEEYNSSKYLQHGTRLHIPLGISNIPGYVKVSCDTSKRLGSIDVN